MVKLYKLRKFFRKALKLSNKVFVVLVTIFFSYLLINNVLYGFLIWGGAQRAYDNKNYGKALVLYNYASDYYKLIRFSSVDKTRHVEAQYQIAQTYLTLGQKINAENAIREGMFEMMQDYGFYSQEYAQYVRDYVVEFYILKKEYRRAKEYLILSEYAYSKLNTDGEELAAINRLYGDVSMARGEKLIAMTYYQNAYRLTKKYNNLDISVVLPIYTRVADFYLDNGDIKQGMDVYEELLKILDMKKVSGKVEAAKINLRIADVCNDKDDYANAIKYYENAYVLIKSLPYNNELREKIDGLRETMAAIYGKLGKYSQQREMTLEIERARRFAFRPIKL